MRIVARVAVLAAVYVAGILVLAALSMRRDLPGFVVGGFVFSLMAEALDRLRLSRLRGTTRDEVLSRVTFRDAD